MLLSLSYLRVHRDVNVGSNQRSGPVHNEDRLLRVVRYLSLDICQGFASSKDRTLLLEWDMQTSTISRIIFIWAVEALLLFLVDRVHSWVHYTFQFIILMGSCTLQYMFLFFLFFYFSIDLDNWATV